MATVLVIDDEDEVREALALALQDAGYAVLQAANGEQALAVLHPDADSMVLLLDRMMPIVSGDYLLLALAASPILRRRHAVIVITAAPNRISDMVRHAMEKLQAVLLPKPFDLATVLRLVERMSYRIARQERQDHLTASETASEHEQSS